MTERVAASIDVEITVPFHDLDPMDVVWHGRYVEYLEQARCALLATIDYDYPAMRASGYAWPVIELQLRYARPARYGQRLRVRAELVEWEHRLRIRFVVRDAASGQRLARGHTVQVAVDAGNGEMCWRSPAVLFERLGLAP
jgi:acyl-CoA thioester hydrolase